MTRFRDIPLPGGEAQGAFVFYDAVAVLRQATEDDVRTLVRFLDGKGWMRALKIIRAKPEGLFLPANLEDAKRRLRAIAQAGPGQILAFPGSQGYRLLREASPVDLNRGANSHRSQARKHLVRFRHILIEIKRRQAAEKAALELLASTVQP